MLPKHTVEQARVVCRIPTVRATSELCLSQFALFQAALYYLILFDKDFQLFKLKWKWILSIFIIGYIPAPCIFKYRIRNAIICFYYHTEMSYVFVNGCVYKLFVY